MMNQSRQKILASIQTALHRGALSIEQKEKLQQRLVDHPRGIIPQQKNCNHEQLVEIFIHEAKKSFANVQRIESFHLIPAFISDLLQREKLGQTILVSTDSLLTEMNWKNASDLTIKTGTADDQDSIAVTSCLCGVAETGTLVLLSGPQSPTLLNFLPETHIVLISTQQIVPAYEDAWDLIRKKGAISRTVNFITGPSRTADIEQTLLIGAHGPKRLYILLAGSPSL